MRPQIKWCKLLKQKGKKQGLGVYTLIEVLNHITSHLLKSFSLMFGVLYTILYFCHTLLFS